MADDRTDASMPDVVMRELAEPPVPAGLGWDARSPAAD